MITTKDPFDTLDLEVSVLVDDNATVVSVTLYDDGGRVGKVYATGSSKRHPGDPRNYGPAKQIALGRALIELGASLVTAGTAATEHLAPIIVTRRGVKPL